MNKPITLLAIVLAALLVTTAAVAHGKPEHGHKNRKAGPIMVQRVDNGSCGSPWATDTVRSDFKVKQRKDGSFRFTRRDRGTFVTTGPDSPGKCETKGKHGSSVVAGVTGKMHGFIVGIVKGGTYNPDGCNADPGVCATGSGTVIALFGAGADARYSCNQNSKDCRFDYEYSAPARENPKLLDRHWSDKGKGAGTMLDEKLHGDIATS